MSDVRGIGDHPHHLALELEAVAALARGDAMAAFEYTDRRCRISPPPPAYSHVLRAEALFRAGDRDGALAALERALTLAPEDLAANRRMLSWGTGGALIVSASVLIRVARDPGTLRRAVETLRADGRRDFVCCRTLEDMIEGWALWEGGETAQISFGDGADRVSGLLCGIPSTNFPGMGRYGRFRIPRPPSLRSPSFVVTVEGRVIHRQSGGPPSAARAAAEPRSDDGGGSGPTVIVPIYGDYPATLACLESLAEELDASPALRAILVNDASPEPEIVALLDRLADRPRVRVLTNARNLGFVGAVNRALEAAVEGDVVLLNADAVAPPGFVSRLSAAARLAPDIGLVMPLSNNGDLASFPLPFVASRMRSRAEIEAIDRVASQQNRGLVVDIPNGIGFCLYITRACLDAIGGLCEDFERGYLEDVDLSLRAKARGFRTVCAPSVYVGHFGAKSFGAEKRALVVRNASIVHARHPGYSLAFAAFASADPLREARQAIQRRLPLAASKPRLLVAGAGAVGAVARARALRLGREQSALLLETRARADGWRATLYDPCGEDAWASEFDLAAPTQRSALVARLREAAVARIEFLDPIQTPFSLVDLLRELVAPYDLVIADAGLLGRAGASRLFAAGGSLSEPADRRRHVGEAGWVTRWRAVAESADQLLAIDRRAQVFAARIFPQRKTPLAPAPRRQPARGAPPSLGGDVRRLGLAPIRSTAAEYQFIREIAKALGERRPDLRLVVLGATLDDAALMRLPHVHVTGPIDGEELEKVAAAYALGRLFACVTRPLFGHPVLQAMFEGSRPLAYLDWTGGALRPRSGDLALDPSFPLASLTERLLGWLETREEAVARPRSARR